MNKSYKIDSLKQLTDSVFVVRMEKNGLQFRAGQNISVAVHGDAERRDYSVYSAEHDNFLEILVKEVENGRVSRKLRILNPGDKLSIDGPFGFFSPKVEETGTRKFLFIASGTGIAPFHSIVLSNPGLDYTLLHGVKYEHEAYDK
ncbi:MAG: FAD-dependent oxidoreductase, partial [Bacteroidales bacterium]|nr:FAD-dependent oxidoreductase [Bacteroidales bacterium]